MSALGDDYPQLWDVCWTKYTSVQVLQLSHSIPDIYDEIGEFLDILIKNKNSYQAHPLAKALLVLKTIHTLPHNVFYYKTSKFITQLSP